MLVLILRETNVVMFKRCLLHFFAWNPILSMVLFLDPVEPSFPTLNLSQLFDKQLMICAFVTGFGGTVLQFIL